MARTSVDLNQHVEAMRKAFDLADRGLTRPLAESILALDFTEDEAARIDDLSEKANEGTMSAMKTGELESYVEVIDLLAYWHSRASAYLSGDE